MNRSGVVLPEVITALVLGAMLVSAILLLTRTQTRLTTGMIEQATQAEALRTAALVLSTETRWISYARDIYSIGRDSLSLRAFRGMGIVCSFEAGVTVLRYRGVRLPDPTKDSTLFVDTEQAFSFSSASETTRACSTQHGESVLSLQGTWPVMPTGAVLLVFESGSYHISGRALRYRRGREGRQPITEEVLDDSGSGFHPRVGEIGGRAVFITAESRAGSYGNTSAQIRFPVMNE